MSAGYLHIDNNILHSREIVTRRKRGQSREVLALTPAQRMIWITFNDVLHKKKGEGNPREGFISFADVAEKAGVCRDTVVVAVRVLEAAGLLMRRRLIDPRGRSGTFFAPNLYRLLTPPSLRTPEEEQRIAVLREQWREAERLQVPWHRHRHEPPVLAAPAPPPPINPAPISPAPVAPARRDPGTAVGRKLAQTFLTACHGEGARPPTSREVAFADSLISQYGGQAARIVAWVADRVGANARSFMIVKHRLPAALSHLAHGGSDRPARPPAPPADPAWEEEQEQRRQRLLDQEQRDQAAQRDQEQRDQERQARDQMSALIKADLLRGLVDRVRECASIIADLEQFGRDDMTSGQDRAEIGEGLAEAHTLLGYSLEALTAFDDAPDKIAGLRCFGPLMQQYRVDEALQCLKRLDQRRRSAPDLF